MAHNKRSRAIVFGHNNIRNLEHLKHNQELAHQVLTRATNHLWQWFSYISATDVDTYKAVSEATTILNNCVCMLLKEESERLERALKEG